MAESFSRYAFLKNNPLTCKHKISFKKVKITEKVVLVCHGSNWGIWQQEKDILVSWIAKNHPNLDGFIHDLTMSGAIHYLNAIEFYKNRTDSTTEE